MTPLPRSLGLAGLLPQLACLAALLSGAGEWRWLAPAIGWAYAALIFSFLGGMWWGIAAAGEARGQKAPLWLWLAAVTPSLLALMTFLPWLYGRSWPGPSLLVLGAAILATPLVDRRLGALVPGWWLPLRLVLSAGLGLATIALGLLSPAAGGSGAA